MQNIEQLEKLHKERCSKKLYKRLLFLWHKLEQMEDEVIQRRLLFLKQKTWTASSKAVKMLAHRVRTQRISRLIPHIKDQNNLIQMDSNQIAKVFYDFYSKLYISANPNTEDMNLFLQKYGLPKLLPEHRKLLEEKFTEEEIYPIFDALNLIKPRALITLPLSIIRG